jgi:hypothetical protein
MVPDLSVDGSQASVTLVWLRLVAFRFVGVVGGVRSLAAATEPTTTDARTRASAAPAARRTTGFFAVISSSRDDAGRTDGVYIGNRRQTRLRIGAKPVSGLRRLRLGLIA